MKKQKGKRAVSFGCQILLASPADRMIDGHFGEKVFEGDGSGKASVNTDVPSSKKENA